MRYINSRFTYLLTYITNRLVGLYQEQLLALVRALLTGSSLHTSICYVIRFTRKINLHTYTSAFQSVVFLSVVVQSCKFQPAVYSGGS